MGYYTDQSGNYYEGDRQGTDQEVTQRPGQYHSWIDGMWIYAPTAEQITTTLEVAVQRHLDAAAKAAGYDNILSACSYAGAPNPFQAEGQAFVTWRGDVWAHCYQVLTDVQVGNRTVPTEAELIAELPALVLPT